MSSVVLIVQLIGISAVCALLFYAMLAPEKF